MSKILNFFYFLFIFWSISLNTQNSSKVSKITYKKSVYENKDTKIENKKMEEVMKKVIEINSKLEYELYFNSFKSYYKIRKFLELDEESPLYKLAVGNPSVYY